MAYQFDFTGCTVGANAYAQLPDICARYGVQKLLAIGGTRALAAAEPALQAALAGSNVCLVDLYWYGGCTPEHIAVLAQHAEGCGAQAIASVGGGRAIDAAKAVAQKLTLPCFTFPATASACAAVTPFSILYDQRGLFSDVLCQNAPPLHCFIDTGLLAQAPPQYLRAGMAAALARHFEAVPACNAPEQAARMAHAMGRCCVGPLYRAGAAALRDNAKHLPTPAFEDAVLACLVSAGYPAAIHGACFGAAQALYFGLLRLPRQTTPLFGDTLGYGALMQLCMDGRTQDASTLCAHLQAWGCPTTLAELGAQHDWMRLADALDEMLAVPGMAELSPRVTAGSLFEAMGVADALSLAQREQTAEKTELAEA